MELLDVEAVQIILERENGGVLYPSNLTSIFRPLFDDMTQNFLGFEDIAIKRAKILQLAMDYIPKEFITLDLLEELTHLISKQEFEHFCRIKQIDLKSEAYSKLTLQYSADEIAPVLKIEGNQPTVMNLLLSRTHSSKLNLDEVKTIYQKLYDLHPIAREMLVYTANLISEHNDVTIIYADNVTSSYNPYTNTIHIDNKFKDSILNIESVTIHEIGHFIYQQAFNFHSLPLEMGVIKKLLTKYFNKYNSHFNDPYIDSSGLETMVKEIAEDVVSDEFKNLIELFKSYEKAARLPVDKAAELIKFNVTEYGKYSYVKEYTEFFKDNSYIDLFTINGGLSFSIEKSLNITNNVPDHLFNNMHKIYLSEQTECKIPYSYNKQLSREEIIKWATEEFIAKLVPDLNLSPTQIHFLERIGDYINRGDDHILRDPTPFNHDQSFKKIEKYVELIVRSMELRAAGVEKDIIDSFAGLDEFHLQYVSPHIHNYIEAAYQKKLALYKESINAFGSEAGTYNSTLGGEINLSISVNETASIQDIG